MTEKHGTAIEWTHGEGWQPVRYVGAGPKSGGRLLDGREWNEMPR